MKKCTQAPKTPFVQLEETVTLASSNERPVKTNQSGMVLGFGCNHCQILLAA